MSTSLTNAPRKSHVQVFAATPQQNFPQPDIVGMKPDAVRELYFGFLVTIWVDRPNSTPIKLADVKSVSIPALMAMSSIIKDVIIANGPSLRDIDHITLPSGHPEAYKMLFKWLDDTTKTGVCRHVQAVYDSPLFHYHHLLEIAKNLNITPIVKKLGPRYKTMLTYKKNSNWNIQSEDVRRAYQELPAGHALRQAIVKGVASAWYYHDLGGAKFKQIEQITWEFPELWEDLNELWESFAQERI